MARWLEIPETPYSLSISPDARLVTVDAVERNQYRNNLPLEVRVGSQRIELKQTASRRYEVALPKNAEGNIALLYSRHTARAAQLKQLEQRTRDNRR